MAERHGPIRTCIGCRQQGSRSELVRHVLEHAADGSAARIVRDDERQLPGRGAWLHDDVQCRQLAAKRRAFQRALRVAGDVRINDDDHEAGHVRARTDR